jgi:hypothetical protein
VEQRIAHAEDLRSMTPFFNGNIARVILSAVPGITNQSLRLWENKVLSLKVLENVQNF